MKNIDLIALCAFKTLASVLRIRPRSYTPVLISLTFSLLHTAFAGSATWKASPGSNDWNTASNWTPATVPNGPSDTATFAFSNTTNVSTSADMEVGSIVFNA